VLISGGDPLVLSDAQLESIIARVRAIDHVEIIRVGSRMPVVCPQRITPELVAMLGKYQPLYFNTHFNHPQEFTAESKLACDRLNDAGIPMGNQTVLMRGINDDARVMKKLSHKLLQYRVKPYYYYQCDLAQGTAHFRTSVSKASRSTRACAATPPASACRPTSSTPSAAAGRRRCSPAT